MARNVIEPEPPTMRVARHAARTNVREFSVPTGWCRLGEALADFIVELPAVIDRSKPNSSSHIEGPSVKWRSFRESV
jgi:hypothetical protein